MVNSTRWLLVVRHAKSDRDRPVADHERTLSPRGRRDAAALGRHLSQGQAVDLVLCSSAARARETWRLAAAALGTAPELEVRDTLYLASPSAVLAHVRSVGDAVRTLAVVGHEPTQSGLVEQLCATASPSAARAFAEGFVTSAVALLRYDGPWSALGPGSCHLEAFDVPRG